MQGGVSPHAPLLPSPPRASQKVTRALLYRYEILQFRRIPDSFNVMSRTPIWIDQRSLYLENAETKYGR